MQKILNLTEYSSGLNYPFTISRENLAKNIFSDYLKRTPTLPSILSISFDQNYKKYTSVKYYSNVIASQVSTDILILELQDFVKLLPGDTLSINTPYTSSIPNEELGRIVLKSGNALYPCDVPTSVLGRGNDLFLMTPKGLKYVTKDNNYLGNIILAPRERKSIPGYLLLEGGEAQRRVYSRFYDYCVRSNAFSVTETGVILPDLTKKYLKIIGSSTSARETVASLGVGHTHTFQVTSILGSTVGVNNLLLTGNQAGSEFVQVPEVAGQNFDNTIDYTGEVVLTNSLPVSFFVKVIE